MDFTAALGLSVSQFFISSFKFIFLSVSVILVSSALWSLCESILKPYLSLLLLLTLLFLHITSQFFNASLFISIVIINILMKM